MNWLRFSNPQKAPVEYRGWQIEHEPRATQVGYWVSARAAPGFGYEARPGKGRKTNVWIARGPDGEVKVVNSLAHAKTYIDEYMGAS